MSKKMTRLFLILPAILFSIHTTVQACTRIFWNDNGVSRMTTRTMDWEVNDEPSLLIMPRGMVRNGGVDDHALVWTSRYGSVINTAWGLAGDDGINEAGLAAHFLFLDNAVTEPRDQRPGVGTPVLIQLFLDRYATVQEALDDLSHWQYVPTPLNGNLIPGHVALEDGTGDSAIIEYIDSRMMVYHGSGYKVLANEPPYDQQMANLKRYRGFGGELPPPGDIGSLDRFVRANYYLSYLPKPENDVEAAAWLMGVGRNISTPYGAPYDTFGTYPTWWRSLIDLDQQIYYFESTMSPNVIWVELKNLDLSEGAPVVTLDPRIPSLVGEVSRSFKPGTAPF